MVIITKCPLSQSLLRKFNMSMEEAGFSPEMSQVKDHLHFKGKTEWGEKGLIKIAEESVVRLSR